MTTMIVCLLNDLSFEFPNYRKLYFETFDDRTLMVVIDEQFNKIFFNFDMVQYFTEKTEVKRIK